MTATVFDFEKEFYITIHTMDSEKNFKTQLNLSLAAFSGNWRSLIPEKSNVASYQLVLFVLSTSTLAADAAVATLKVLPTHPICRTVSECYRIGIKQCGKKSTD